MSQTLITVVTVTYNAEKLLEKTILSVINQSYENIEYIIIDGASTDGTIEIIKKYEDKVTYWISEPDKGIYYAMNKAIEKATGEWINFMNAGDTFFNSDIVSEVFNQNTKNSELIYGNVFLKEQNRINKAKDLSQWNFQMPFCHQTLFTKTTIMKQELFDTSFKLAADHNFIVKMYKNNKKFHYVDKTIAIFSLGGFAESNKFLMNIESLKVLLDNNVPLHEVNQSYWYEKLIETAVIKEKNHIINLEKIIKNKEKMIRDQSQKLHILHSAIHKIINYSILKNPIKKYKSYKIMISKHYKVRNKTNED